VSKALVCKGRTIRFDSELGSCPTGKRAFIERAYRGGAAKAWPVSNYKSVDHRVHKGGSPE